MAKPILNYIPIQAGDLCTVVFDGTTPDLPARFQRFLSDSGEILVTTPPGELDPDLQTTHYIDDYQYIQAGNSPGISGSNDLLLEVGDNIEVVFGCCPAAPEPPENPPRTVLFTFSGNPNADEDEFLYYGQAQMDNNTGFVAPFDGTITVISTNQDGNDDSPVQVRINNSTVETLNVTSRNHIFNVDIPVTAGQRVTAFNTDEEDLRDFTMSFIYEETVAPSGGTGGGSTLQTLTGQVTKINLSSRAFEIDDGSDLFIVYDAWYVKKL